MPTGGAGGAGVAGGFGGTAGTGGAGTGGTGDSGSSGAGNGGAGGLPDDWAKCLTDLVARCPLVGSCVRSEAEGVMHSCYPDGTRTESEEVPTQLCEPDLVERVYGSDGSLCYTSTQTRGLACEHPSTRYSDGDGNPVVLIGGPSSLGLPNTFTCSGGVAIQFDTPPPLPLPSRPICEPGVCPLGEGGMGGAP
jgi:hypothetical protein